jgi:tetratricopeptide (TPR) repeat protein
MSSRKMLLVMLLVGVQLNISSCAFHADRGGIKIEQKASFSKLFHAAYERTQMADYQSAIDSYSKRIQVSPDAPTHTNRGLVYARIGNYTAAIADYDQAIKLDSNWALAYINRGSARASFSQDYKGAIADFDQAIRLDPKLVEAYNSRGAARRDSGDLKGAIKDLSQAIELDPQNSRAYHNRANSYFDAGNTQAAIDDLTQAIKIQPNSVEFYRQRAEIFTLSGDRTAALADYGRIIDLAKTQEDLVALRNASEAVKHLQDDSKISSPR